MPAEAAWDSYFDGEKAIELLFHGEVVDGQTVDFGCGYGTFTIPAAKRTLGNLTALDIDPAMVRLVTEKAAELSLGNVHAIVRDFLRYGTGLPNASHAHAMIFNLLHVEDPLLLLGEARRILQDDGVVSIIHWRSDIPTPRGPPANIRPTPLQCRKWLAAAGFGTVELVDISEACPYHFALIGS